MLGYETKFQPVTMHLGTLKHERSKWDNYPSCQREEVWDDAMKRKLIDTILRGLYIPNLVAVTIRSDMYGKTYGIVDGQQRLKTILGFIDGEFRTASNKKQLDEPAVDLIEPNRNYDELSPAARNYFNSYFITITLIEQNLGDETIGLQFRRLNYQRKLSFAEHLFSYNTQTKEYAQMLLEHPFWAAHLNPKYTQRKRSFQMGVYMLFLEHRDGIGNVTSPQTRYAVGAPNLITEEISKTVEKRLGYLNHLFGGRSKGVEINTMGDIIWMYQAVMFLDQSNVNIRKSPEGVLSQWFMSIKKEIIQRNKEGGGRDRFAADIQKAHKQREFWDDHIKGLLDVPDLVKLDDKRLFDMSDKMYAWEQQKGLCPICKKAVTLSDVGHHKIRYEDGGETVPENCLLVHAGECHRIAETGMYQATLGN